MKNGGDMTSPENPVDGEKVPSYKEVKELVREAWSGDYSIVNHGGDPFVSSFGEPRPHGEYSVTIKDLLEMDETAFVGKLNEGGKPLVVLIQCMDKRGAALGYEMFRDNVLKEADLEGANIFHFAAGGGIIQREEVIREGETVTTKREEAFKALMGFVARKAEKVKLVMATGHDCRCGAEAFAADGQGWPEQLNCEPGSVPEQDKMKSLISEFAKKLLPEEWQEDGIVVTRLVAFNDSDNPSVEFLRTE